jgi:hypothetical protein
MPFTFSHPAIILPGKYLPAKWISMTGLVIGSMVPDFEYFIRMRNLSLYSHTWSSMFWFDLPLALVLTFVYHNLVRDSLLSNLPLFLRKRLLQFNRFDWNRYVRKHFIVVLASLLIGISSHLLWDGFTHRQGQFVKSIPWLKENSTLFWNYPRYYVLQHLFSLAGLLVILAAIMRISAEIVPARKGIIEYWLIALCIALLVVAVRLLSGLDYKQEVDLAMTIISAGLIALIITPLIIYPRA